MLSTKIPPILENWLCHVLPMLWKSSNSRKCVSTSDVFVSSPCGSDNIKIIRSHSTCKCVHSLCNEFLKLSFRHVLDLIWIWSKTKSHVSRNTSQCSDVDKVCYSSSFSNVVWNDSNVLLSAVHSKVFLGDDQDFTNVSHLEFLNGFGFPVRKSRRKGNGVFLEDSEWNSNHHFAGSERLTIWTCDSGGVLPSESNFIDGVVQKNFDVFVLREVLSESLVPADDQRFLTFKFGVISSVLSWEILEIWRSLKLDIESCTEHKVFVGDFFWGNLLKSIISWNTLLLLELFHHWRVLLFFCFHLVIHISSIFSKNSHTSIICRDVFDVWYLGWKLVQWILRRPSVNPIGSLFKPKNRFVVQSHWCWFGSSSNVPIGLKNQDFFSILSQIISSRSSGNTGANYDNIVLIWGRTIFRGIGWSEYEKNDTLRNR